MTYFALAAVSLVMKFVVGIWILAAIILILIVMLQKGRGGGLGAAFGGAGNSLLGSKTGDFLTWVTICIVGLWLLLSVVSAKWFRPKSSDLLQSDKAPIAAVSDVDPEKQAADANTPDTAE